MISWVLEKVSSPGAECNCYKCLNSSSTGTLESAVVEVDLEIVFRVDQNCTGSLVLISSCICMSIPVLLLFLS